MKIIQKTIEIIGLGGLLILCTIIGIIRLMYFPIKTLRKTRQKEPKVSLKLDDGIITDPKKDICLDEGLDIAYKAFGSRAEKYAVIAARTNDKRGSIRAIMFELLAYYTLITLS